jgi:hypothetical protein
MVELHLETQEEPAEQNNKMHRRELGVFKKEKFYTNVVFLSKKDTEKLKSTETPIVCPFTSSLTRSKLERMRPSSEELEKLNT